MKNFFDGFRCVSEVVLAIFVPTSACDAIHKNRPSHGLAFNCGSEVKYAFDDGTVYSVEENDIIYLPKHSNYKVHFNGEVKTYCINFQLLHEDEFSPFVIHASHTEEILRAYKNAEKTWIRAKEGREYLALSELYKILYELQKISNLPYLPESKRELIKPAVDYIHKHYTDELISVEKLSALCGISYDYLRKLFEKLYGCSPIKFINGLKLKRAKELLSSGLYSVSEVTFLAGFSDLSHFSRFFKKNEGVSPSDYINPRE